MTKDLLCSGKKKVLAFNYSNRIFSRRPPPSIRKNFLDNGPFGFGQIARDRSALWRTKGGWSCGAVSSGARSRTGFDYLISDIRECDRAAISGLMGHPSAHPLAPFKGRALKERTNLYLSILLSSPLSVRSV